VEYNSLFCGKCSYTQADVTQVRSKINWEGIADVAVPYEYGPGISGAILAMKRYRDSRATDYYADKIAAMLSDCNCDIVIPVPMSGREKRKRGYNHAGVLAEALGGKLGVPFESGLLSRKDGTVLQRSLDRGDRFENAQKSYAPGKDFMLAEGKHILLVDDVLTTGATIIACCLCLKSSGAERVSVAAICSTNEKELP